MAPALWLAVVSVTAIAGSTACPSEEWLLNDGNCYWKAPFEIAWMSGDETCYSKYEGSRMVSIHDMVENAFVTERVGNGRNFWIGIWRRGTGYDWEWTDGTPVNYTNWCEGQPPEDGQVMAYIPASKNGCWVTSSYIGYTSLVCKVADGV